MRHVQLPAVSLIAAARESLKNHAHIIELAPPSSTHHPDLVLVDPDRGLIAVDVHASIDHDAKAEFVQLNRRVAALQADTEADEDLPIARVLVVRDGLSGPKTSLANRLLVPLDQFGDLSWLQLISEKPINQIGLNKVRAVLFPAIAFDVKIRHGISNEGADDRAALRVVLDAQQAQVAARDVRDTLLLIGPPGSGKTLVLAARAKRLAAEHPGWRIQMLCYNKTLVPYLRRLVIDYPNVRVNRVWEIASEFNLRFSYADDAVLKKALKDARASDLPRPFDAILIDEVQDFRIAWLELAHALLRPGRGGMVLAGDHAQAIYTDEDHLESFVGKRHADRVELRVPYRSTRQILSAVSALDPSFDIVGIDRAPEGPPVDLVWAESWDEQANCIAAEIKGMLHTRALRPKDIGILVTQYRGAYGRLKRALDECGIRYTAMEPKEKVDFDLFSNTVKLLTVHSAKGYEFRVVVLFGLEALPDPEKSDPETLRRGRVAFVGATRAMDNLIITYTRSNVFLKKLSSDERDVARWNWPVDYEEVSDGG